MNGLTPKDQGNKVHISRCLHLKGRVLPRIWKQGVKIEIFFNLGGQKLVTQFTRMFIATLYIDITKT